MEQLPTIRWTTWVEILGYVREKRANSLTWAVKPCAPRLEFKLLILGSMKNRICALNLQNGDACDSAVASPQAPGCPTRQRLARGFSRLQEIQLVRSYRQDPGFGNSADERIIWRELLELELQDVDEQIERILAAAATEKSMVELSLQDSSPGRPGL